MIRAATALPILLAAATAAAQAPRPVTQPTRDVEVIYALTKGAQQLQERSRWQAASGKQRVDAPGGGGTYMISDRTTGTVAMVNDGTRKVIQMTTPPGPLTGGPAGFTRLGTLTIAGLACTEWTVTPENTPQATPNQICLTNDGVLLGIRTGDVQRARATTVTYAPADPAAFAIPADYQRVTPKPATR